MASSYVDSNPSLSFDFINKHPLLQKLITWYQQVGTENKDNENKHGFLKHFIDTIANNFTKSSNNLPYSDTIKNFALSLYILGGKLTYEFIRLNLPGSLPSLTMLNTLISNLNSKISEAEFRFDQLQKHFDDYNVQYAFGSEDTTGIIKKIKYDSTTNTFNGFPTPPDHGVPIKEYYQTNSFDTLKLGFNSIDKSSLLNVHMIQPVQSINQSIIPSPFLLSAYGIDNTATANDILQRWWYIFNQCLQRNIRIIGFSTGEKINPTHLVTKWRNRLLSSTAELCLGNQFILISHLHDIINNETYSKLDRGLTKSDINPKDRQNFSSCLKLTSADLFKILNDDVNTRGTLIYLQMLKMIILAYVEKKTTIAERMLGVWYFSVEYGLHGSNSKHLIQRKLQKTLNNESDNNLVFPVHHKHRNDRQSSFTQSQSEIDQIDIERIITEAYHEAMDMLDELLSEYVFKQLNSTSKMYDYSSQLSNIDGGEFEIADDDEDETTDDLNIDDDNNDSFSSNDDYSDDDEKDDTRDLINTAKKRLYCNESL
ncbi:unnamed protein product [Rotaria sp. Silwood1]|nr:unnamed protein product [Rotaria sp. Silwood1]